MGTINVIDKNKSNTRCGYVPNWEYTRASTVSPRTDKVATRGVYTGKYGVSTDRQGSNADHAGNAYGAKTDFKEEHGDYWVLLRSLHGGVRCLLGYLRNVDG